MRFDTHLTSPRPSSSRLTFIALASRWIGGLFLGASLVTGCGGGSGTEGGDPQQNPQGNATINDGRAIEAKFNYSASETPRVYYACFISPSATVFNLVFNPLNQIGVVHAYYENDAHQQNPVAGSFTWDGAFHMNFPGLVNGSQNSQNHQIRLGMLYAFTTENLICSASGHEYNVDANQNPLDLVHLNYACPTIRVQVASSESNGLDFNAPGFFNTPVRGRAYRQRVTVNRVSNTETFKEANGIYRILGNQAYAFLNGIEDTQYLTLNGVNNWSELSVEELEPQAGNCRIR